ncbi:hypothetical protein LCGC14_3059410 [marine sediment metagenome]|uniref:Uncharacterized protein n=1 Tax=marine sediment metagenome TaxID=412755 RepID=A0A0F8WJX6_9ZZZZ
MNRSRYSSLYTWPFAALSVFIMGCVGGSMEDASSAHLQMAPIDEMPLEVQRAPVAVRQAYQFAVANAVLLRQGFEFEDRRSAEQRRVDREKRVLRSRPDKQDQAVLHVAQDGI